MYTNNAKKIENCCRPFLHATNLAIHQPTPSSMGLCGVLECRSAVAAAAIAVAVAGSLGWCVRKKPQTLLMMLPLGGNKR